MIEINFNPDIGIVIYYSSGVKITVVGLHLAALYRDIAEHRILEIRSMDTLVALHEHQKDEVTGKDAPLVQDVVIERGMIDADTGVWKSAEGVWNARNQEWQPSRMH
jgi:hypothetical protein